VTERPVSQASAPPLGPQTIVVFGASGDLTRRKLLPALFSLLLQGLMPAEFRIVGYGRTEMDDEAFRELAADSIRTFGPHPPQGEAWDRMRDKVHYLAGGFTREDDLAGLADLLDAMDERDGTRSERVFHFSIPPAVYPELVRRIGEVGLQTRAKVVFEKPFGQDLRSSRELNEQIHSVFEESQVYRIDHYLGKDTVRNVLAFRFANGLFEPVWNRRYIDHVQVTVAEEIGIEGRGEFYEQVGAVRDMVVTHLFQVMTFLGMEPPVSFEPDRLRDETVKLLRATSVCDPNKVVRGQYEGYRGELGVDPDSAVETYAALELAVDNWRWADVPFLLRTGKGLAAKASEVTLKFRKVPFNVFRGSGIDAVPARDHLTIRLQPNEGITVALNAKVPGPGSELGRVRMDFDYEREFHTKIPEAYEILLRDVMEGDRALFLREDLVDRAWEIVQPVLEHPSPIVPYPRGSWGPAAADELIAPRKWHVAGDVADV
jgi:glucose-6-phosphate 1-dehydrogenase